MAKPDMSATARRKRRLLVLESQRLRGGAAWWDDLREELEPAAKAGYAAGRADSLVNSFDYALVVVAIFGAVSAFSHLINWVFVVYAALALRLRSSSRRIFAACLLSAVLIPVASLLKRQELADSFAVMALYFLGLSCVRWLFERYQR